MCRIRPTGLSGRSAVGVCAVACFLASCRASDRAPTAVHLEVLAAAAGPRPTSLDLSWMDARGALFDGQRVPRTGTLPASGPLASVQIEVQATAPSERKIIVRGLRDQSIVGEAAASITVVPGRQVNLVLVLSPERLPDVDGDQIPDVVDDCPGAAGPGGCPEPLLDMSPADGGFDLPDATAPGPPDAESPDVATATDTAEMADAGGEPPDAPALSEDAGSEQPDAGPALLKKGEPCEKAEECATRHCAGGGAGRRCASPGMVAVPAGKFVRGCDKAMAADCANDETPKLTLTLAAFEIDITEVTQAAYEGCVKAGTCRAPRSVFDPATKGRLPISNVTWFDARDFCAWAGKRLPTEAEWEKAARGTDGRRYPWGGQAPTCQLAHHGTCAPLDTPVPVASRTGISPYGAHDMAGNVEEWVADWYGETYYQSAPSTDPKGPSTGTDKVRRGGNFGGNENYLRCVSRLSRAPDDVGLIRGFRCARGLP